MSTYVVTGSASGIGAATATALERAGIASSESISATPT